MGALRKAPEKAELLEGYLRRSPCVGDTHQASFPSGKHRASPMGTWCFLFAHILQQLFQPEEPLTRSLELMPSEELDRKESR
jgi:hypothetical protein